MLGDLDQDGLPTTSGNKESIPEDIAAEFEQHKNRLKAVRKQFTLLEKEIQVFLEKNEVSDEALSECTIFLSRLDNVNSDMAARMEKVSKILAVYGTKHAAQVEDRHQEYVARHVTIRMRVLMIRDKCEDLRKLKDP